MTNGLEHRRMDSIAAANILVTDARDVIEHPVIIHDDTLRDGEQTIGVALSIDQKVELATRLIDAGVKSFLPGFPAISKQEQEAVRAILALGGPAADVMVFARATKHDIEVAMGCGATGVSMFIPLSDSHLHYKLGIDEETAYARMLDSIALAKSYGLRIRFGFEDLTRAPLERIRRFAGSAVEAGAMEIAVADTVGILTPFTTYGLVKELLSVMGEAPLLVHFHDDLGMATANCIMAALAGARLISGTLCGLGERAGNACLEEIAVALRVKYGTDCGGVDLSKLAATARWVSELTGFPIAHNKPVLGRNTFRHETGIHVHGLMRERCTYEPFPPELIGAEHVIHYGKHSGLSNVEYLARTEGIEASEEAMQRALAVIKEMGASGRAPSSAEAARILRAAVEQHESSHE